MSALEICAAVIGVISVYLTVRQNIWCWPIGLCMVLMYGWIFYDGKLYSNMLLQGVYALLQVYGWWQWRHGGSSHSGVTLSSLSLGGVLQGLVAGLVGAVLLSYAMTTYTDAAMPWQDASLSVFSLVAQLWMAQKRLQCWLLWIVIDSLSVALFIHQELYATAALYGLFTLLAVHGWRSWRAAQSVVKA